MLLLELLQPVGRQSVQEAVLVPCCVRKQLGLLHDFFILDLKAPLLLPPHVIAQRSVEVGILALDTLDA